MIKNQRFYPARFVAWSFVGENDTECNELLKFSIEFFIKSLKNYIFYPARFVEVSFVGKNGPYIIKFLKFSIEIFGKIDDQESKILPGTFCGMVICGRKRYIMQWIIEIFDKILDQILEKLYILPGTLCGSLICGQKRSINYQDFHIFYRNFW